MKRTLITLIAALYFSLGWFCNTIPAYAALQSTYPETCQNITLEGINLRADCKTIAGDNRRSRLELKGIVNDNGQLIDTLVHNKDSSFQETCDTFSIESATLSAKRLFIK
jgi:hypothetical protein